MGRFASGCWLPLFCASLALLSGCGDGKNVELVVVAPGQEVTFSVDGGEPIEVTGKSRRVVKVKEGKHTLKVTAPTPLEHTLTTASFDTWVVPVLNEQCFGKLDVSLSHYGKRHKKMAPSLRQLRREKEPFKPKGRVFFHNDELPSSNSDGKPVWLLRSASCKQLQEAMAAQKKRDAKLLPKRKAAPKK